VKSGPGIACASPYPRGTPARRPTGSDDRRRGAAEERRGRRRTRARPTVHRRHERHRRRRPARAARPSPSRSAAKRPRGTPRSHAVRRAHSSARRRARSGGDDPHGPAEEDRRACPPNPRQASATTRRRPPSRAAAGRRERPAHREHGERDDGHGDELEPVDPAAPATSAAPTSSASAVIATADGSVKPSHAAAPPRRPARCAPIAIPSWLEDGPGSRFVTATSSANSRSSSHLCARRTRL
jgi:hypothetical protein